MTSVFSQPPVWSLLVTVLPGSDRQRTSTLYHYRIKYRAAQMEQPGCVASWDVLGGREAYQVDLERRADGSLCWHCTCADAVYRGSQRPFHVCKHVRGLHQCGFELHDPSASDAA